MSARARRAAALAALLLVPAAAAARGGLDRSFGAGGVVYSSSTLDGRGAAGYGIAEDASGRIVVAGVATDSVSSPHVALWRFSARGAPDASYGRGGVGVSPEIGWAWSMSVDARGRVLAPGIKATYGKPSQRAVLERWNPDGGRDSSFGAGGRAEAADPYGGASAEGAAAGTDGRVVLLAGEASDGARRMVPTVWRLAADGAFDVAFGSASAQRLTEPDGVAEGRVSALLPLSGGGWLAAGTLDWKRLALWRLKADGTIDWDFAAGGLALSDGVGRALAEDGAGGAWAAGFQYSGVGEQYRESAVLAHFAADGSTTSWAALDVPGLRDREAFALARAKDGRLFVGGYADMGARPVRACVWALRPDGAPDRRFAPGGVLVLPQLPGGEERIYALALDARGRLLAAGVSRDAQGRRRLAVWRIATR